MSELDRAFAALAATQFAVACTDQAYQLGFTAAALRHRIEAGRLERIGRRCVRIAGAPETWHQLLMVGVLDLGDGAVVAGRSAAALLGLDGFSEGPVELLVPRSSRRLTTVGTVRSTALLGLIDRTVIAGLATTSAARCIVDLAGQVSPRELENAVDSALRLGWTSDAFLRRRLTELRHRGRKGVVALDRVLDGAGGHSRLEREFLALVHAAGLPKPTCQQIHRDGTRFVARSDFSFEPHARVIVEVAGHATHATRRQRQRDAQRQSELQLLGYMVLTFTWEDVTERPGWVLTIVRRALTGLAA